MMMDNLCDQQGCEMMWIDRKIDPTPSIYKVVLEIKNEGIADEEGEWGGEEEEGSGIWNAAVLLLIGARWGLWSITFSLLCKLKPKSDWNRL